MNLSILLKKLKILNLIQLSPAAIAGVLVLLVLPAKGQLSSSAYRALGQPSLYQGGTNIVVSSGMAAPTNVAIDTNSSPSAIYVADTTNNRILAWRDSASFQSGDPAALVLGQPNSYSTLALGTGQDGLAGPLGLAVEPVTGNLYVADFGNNRVVRFLAPFSNPSRVEPDTFYGQPSFSVRTANSSGINANSMKGPRAVAFDSKGNLWIVDTGNDRIIRYPAGVLSSTNPAADLVLGQKDFVSASANGGSTVNASGFDTPAGLVFDGQDNLFVADFNNARVLRFAAPLTLNEAATVVFGQSNFTSKTVPATPSTSSLAGPQGLAVAAGNLYVAVPNDNRILAFPITGASASAAQTVLGQTGFTTNQPNAGTTPRAGAASLALPSDITSDANGNLFIADTGNNRVLAYPAGSTSANRVLGQHDLISNGVNQTKPGSLNAAYKMVIDYSQTPSPLFVSDANNHRVLIWRDSAGFQTGAAADLVIGQPDLFTALPNVDSGTGTPTATSLYSPRGLAVDGLGTLYVADSANSRVLRYPSPLSQVGRITPDAVIGQPSFTSNSSSVINAGSLKGPGGLAIGPNGDLFVADSGNNRVLEFAPHPGTASVALRVYGQGSFFTGSAPTSNSSQSLSAPQGIAVDPASNLYVVDLNANRVVVYTGTSSAPASGASATLVLGQAAFNTGSASAGTSGLRAPIDVAIDGSGTIYVADGGNNRVLGFPSLIQIPVTAAAATAVFGQGSLTGTSVNYNTPDGNPTPQGLFSPAGIFVDRRNTLYIGDSGNSRVIQVLRSLAVFNAALEVPTAPVSRGAVATAFAVGGLSDSTETYSTPNLPLSLASRQIIVNDQILAPLFYVGQSGGLTQINLFFPTTGPLGPQNFALRDTASRELIAGTIISVVDTQPGLSTSNGLGTGQAAAFNQDGTLNSGTNPAPRGTYVTLFGTGMGPVDQSIPDGTPAPTSPLANTLAIPTSNGTTCLNVQPSVCVAVGSTFATIQFSGLTPGFFGLWQLNVQIPAAALTGPAIPVRAVINDTTTNLVTLGIK